MKKIHLFLILIVLIISSSVSAGYAEATQLPKPIVDAINAKLPGTSVRFDGLVELSDKTSYLPVLPLMYANVKNPAQVVQTIPAKTNISKKPDMILFANNLALLKIVTAENGDLTVNYSPEIPLNVKLGILPQDLIVPHGLILPTELKVILGNLKIRIKQKKDDSDLVFYGNPQDSEKKAGLITGKTTEKNIVNIPEMKFLRNRAIYSSNFYDSSVNIINSQTGRIQKTMKLPSYPSSMVLTPDERYLLVSLVSLNKLLIIDTFSNLYLKELKVGKSPSCILMERGIHSAYIANKFSSGISVVDMDNMVNTKEIPVIGNPDNLVFSEDKQGIYYLDTKSGTIYFLSLGNGICSKIFQIDNISKFEIHENKLYILSRSNNELIIFDLKENKENARVKVGDKPIDIKMNSKTNEIYVLCSGTDELYVIDSKSTESAKTLSLKTGGFPSRITFIEKENKLLITNNNAYQITVYDIEKGIITGHIPVSKPISFLQLSR